MDVALYVGLTIALVVIGGLAIFLTRLLRRKGRDHSLYSMARNGKYFAREVKANISIKLKGKINNLTIISHVQIEPQSFTFCKNQVLSPDDYSTLAI